jgi:integrase
MAADESLWPSRADTGCGLTSGTFYAQLQRYLKSAELQPAGVHILRHTAAKLRRDARESIEEVSRFLDHSSLAVTTTYLRRLEGQEDRGWSAVAEAIGAFAPSRECSTLHAPKEPAEFVDGEHH